MAGEISNERAQELVTNGLASSLEQAREVLRITAETEQRSDLVVIFNSPVVRDLLRNYLVREQAYCVSAVRYAFIASGALNAVLKPPIESGPIAVGRLIEMVSRDQQDASLTAVIRNYTLDGKAGIFLTPFDGKAVRDRGQHTFDDHHNLHRIEFQPFNGDPIFGMFLAWKQASSLPLVLYIPHTQTISL